MVYNKVELLSAKLIKFFSIKPDLMKDSPKIEAVACKYDQDMISKLLDCAI